MVYFRFRSAQKANDADDCSDTATAAMIATSVVINGASAACVRSGSIGTAADGAGSTVKYVEADELHK